MCLKIIIIGKRWEKKKTPEKKIFLKRIISCSSNNPNIFIGRMEVLKLKFIDGK